MEPHSNHQSPKTRFSLRALIALVGIAAILFATAIPLFDLLTTTPLSQSVALINDRIPGVAKGKHRMLSEKAVLAAIESGLARRDVPDHVTSVLEGIASSRRLPKNVMLTHDVYYKGSTPGNPPIEVFTISLWVSNKPSGEFTLPICEIENGYLGQ